MSQTPRRSRRLSSNPDRDPVPQWFFAAFTGDRSGSMSSMEGASGLGLYNWVKTMQKSANNNGQEGFISVTTFDDVAKSVFNNVSVKTIKFTKDDAMAEMAPRGTTRLYDTAVEDIDKLLNNVKTFRQSLHPYVRKLNPTISMTWACCTDGKDNASISNFKREFRDKVLFARGVGVKCFFIAANQDAILTGNQYGFSGDNSLSFSSNRQNAAAAFRSVSENMRRVSSGSSDTPFTQNMRQSSLAEDYQSGIPTLPAIPRGAAALTLSPSVDPLNQTIRRGTIRTFGIAPRLVRQRRINLRQ